MFYIHPVFLPHTHTFPLPLREQHTEMERKLKDLSSKVIVGGVNLLEKAEHQQKLLEQSAKEMAKRKKKEAKLTKQLRKYTHTCIGYSILHNVVMLSGKKLKECTWKRSMQLCRKRLQPRLHG